MSETTTPGEGGTATLTRPDEDLTTGTDVRPDDGGGHDRFSHYVQKDRLVQATIEGTPVVALCGKLWSPKHSPKGLPVCPVCKEVWEAMDEGPGAGDQS